MPDPLIADLALLKKVKPARLSDRQVSDLEFLRAHVPASALWHEVGVGKTHPTAYRVLEIVRPTIESMAPPPAREGGYSIEERTKQIVTIASLAGRKRALILMRRSLFVQWKEKILSLILGYAQENPEWRDVSVGVLQSGKNPELLWGRGYENVPDILLTNYDYVPSLLKEVKGGGVEGWLAGLVPSLAVLVADEAHKLKGFRGFRSNKGIRARIINRIAPMVPLRIGISGSPALNPESSDVWGIYHFLDPVIFGPTRWQFTKEFFFDVSKDPKYEMLVMKPGMASELSRRIYMIARRITKKDCPKGEFPEPRRIRYDVELPPEVRRVYRDLEDTGIAVAEGEQVTRLMLLSRLMALQQVASGFIKEDGRDVLLDNSHKVEQMFEILEEIGNVPAVVWCHFRFDCEYVEKILKQDGYRSVLAYGGMSKRDLDANVDAFKSGRADILVGQPAAVGIGMDFQRAQHSIRYSRSYVPEDFEQSEGRTNRAFSPFDETVHHEIVCAQTRDVLIYESLIEKIDLSKSLLLDDVLPVERNA